MTEKRGSGSWFEHIMLILNILVLIGLVAAYAGGSISPSKFWPLAFAAMAYPLILLIIVFLSFYWVLKRNWIVFLNLAFVLIRWDYAVSVLQISGSTQTELNSSSFKVMSFNVRLFDYFKWAEDGDTRIKSFDFLYKQQPNVLCIQELYIDERDDFQIMDTLLSTNSIKHAHIENYRDQGNQNRIWGMATFSSYPIVDKGIIDFESTYGNRCLYTDLKLKNDTVRVYNLHLQSVRIGNDQYLFIDRLMLNKSLEGVPISKLFGDLKLLIYRMVYAFIERGKQAEQVNSHIADSPYPVILCGDFNDTPTSYSYRVLSKCLDDSFVEAGSGFGNTYVRVPFFRIDNIFFSPELECLNHQVHHEQILSDHYAISADLSLAP